MKRVLTIMATALLASTLLAGAAEARGGGGGGGGHMGGFGGGGHIGGFGGGGRIGGAGGDHFSSMQSSAPPHIVTAPTYAEHGLVYARRGDHDHDRGHHRGFFFGPG